MLVKKRQRLGCRGLQQHDKHKGHNDGNAGHINGVLCDDADSEADEVEENGASADDDDDDRDGDAYDEDHADDDDDAAIYGASKCQR